MVYTLVFINMCQTLIMNIKFLQAVNGDAIWISFQEKDITKNILIDSGTKSTYLRKSKKGKMENGPLNETIETIKKHGQKFDLVILTHIDDDHIGGILEWFRQDEDAPKYIGEVWFNSGRTIAKYLNERKIEIESLFIEKKSELTSVPQGIDFENHIRNNKIWNEQIVKLGDTKVWDNTLFQILSPSEHKLEILLKEWHKKAPDSTSLNTSKSNSHKKTLKELIMNDHFEEDNSPYNGSSIAFILTRDDVKGVFLGDSHPSEIIHALNQLGYNENKRLKADFVKLSHHGSKKNTSIQLLKLIDTNKFVISTNGNLHDHPDKETLGRIVSVNPQAKIYFNYPQLISELILQKDKTDFPDVTYMDMDTKLL